MYTVSCCFYDKKKGEIRSTYMNIALSGNKTIFNFKPSNTYQSYELLADYMEASQGVKYSDFFEGDIIIPVSCSKVEQYLNGDMRKRYNYLLTYNIYNTIYMKTKARINILDKCMVNIDKKYILNNRDMFNHFTIKRMSKDTILNILGDFEWKEEHIESALTVSDDLLFVETMSQLK